MLMKSSNRNNMILKKNILGWINSRRTFMILILACVLQLTNSHLFAQSTTISLDLKNVSVEQVLNAIEAKTTYRFLYNKQLVDVNRKVTVVSDNRDVSHVLNEIFKNTDVSYGITGKQIVLSKKNTNFQALKKVPGVVTDQNGDPIIGASVFVKGTSIATITDNEGNFSLNVPVKSTLSVSYIGYTPLDVKVGSQEKLVIKLEEDSKALSEVVVTGYGIQKRGLLSSSIATVNINESMKDLAVSSSAELLTGRMAGIRVNAVAGKPGSQPGVSIRTNSSWNSQPVLYVIDGMIYNSTISGASGASIFQSLSPSEIDKVTVLKDAAAAAAYGARAAGGVIIVTTNRGKVGKPTVNYSFSYAADSPVDEVPLTNLYQSGLLVNQMYKNIGQTPPAGTAWAQEELDWAKSLPGQGYDALKYVWKTPFIMNHSLSISGGSEKLKYFAVANYFDQGGFLKSTDYKRLNLRLNVTADITSNLQLYAGFSLQKSYTASAPTEGTDATYTKLRASFNSFPTMSDQGDRYMTTGWAYGSAAAEAEGLIGYQHTDFVDPQGSINLTYKVPWVDGLSLKASYNADWSNRHYKEYDSRYTFWYPNFSGPNSHIVNADNSNITKSFVNSGFNGIYSTANWGFNNQLNLQATFDRTFGKHYVNGTLVYEKANWGSSYIYNQSQYFPVYQTDQYWATSRDNANSWSGGGPDVELGRASFVGQMNYAYAGKYLASFSVRRDGSMNFSPNKRWGTFPAGSVGWVASQENFLKDNKVITNLKLRASAGITGNDAVGGWQWQQSYATGSTYYLGSPSATPSVGVRYGSLVNPNLTWEKNFNYNVGVDYEFIKHLSGAIDLWYTHNFDILGSRQNTLPTTFSLSMPSENYGVVDAKGIELSVGWKQKSGEVDWHANLTASYGTNNVKVRDYPTSYLPIQVPVGKTTNYITGYTSYIIRTQEQLDVFKAANPTYVNPGDGNMPVGLGSMVYADVSGPNGTPDGVLNIYDQKVLYKNPNPIVYGLNLGLRYKNFSMETVFSGLINNPKNFGALCDYYEGQMINTRWIGESWTPDNPNAPLPMVVPRYNRSYSVTNSSFWYKDASFIRLSNLNLSYTLNFPKALGNAIQNVRFFVSGTNLLCISKFKDWDPELGPSWSGIGYPIMRTFSGGVSIKF
jgi:TonB-linked SusC/RagA family outer membrane protein